MPNLHPRNGDTGAGFKLAPRPGPPSCTMLFDTDPAGGHENAILSRRVPSTKSLSYVSKSREYRGETDSTLSQWVPLKPGPHWHAGEPPVAVHVPWPPQLHASHGPAETCRSNQEDVRAASASRASEYRWYAQLLPWLGPMQPCCVRGFNGAGGLNLAPSGAARRRGGH